MSCVYRPASVFMLTCVPCFRPLSPPFTSVDYFDVISQSYLHLVAASGENQSELDKMGASVESFVDMLAQAKIYAKTATKTRRLMLLVAQSKQAWDWRYTLKIANAAGAAKSGKGPPVSQLFDVHDDPILQYMRISFAEYVELLGRLALQMAHDRTRRFSPSPTTMRTTVSRVAAAALGSKVAGVSGDSMGRASLRSVIARAKKHEKTGKEGKQKQVTPGGKGKWHASLDMDRAEFVEQLPRLFQKLKAMLVEIQLNLRSEGRDSTLKSLLRRSGAAAKASRRGSVVVVMQTVRKKLEAREEEEEKALLNSGKDEFDALRQAVDVSIRDSSIRF